MRIKKNTLRVIVLVCLLCIVVAVGIGYRLYNKPHRSAASETALVVSAAALATGYEKDEGVSNKKYLGRVLQVSGTVSDVSVNQQHKTVIILTGSDLSGVQCSLLEEAPAVKKGDTLTIKGFCAGYLTDVILDRCILVH
jgi:hypothetical protein